MSGGLNCAMIEPSTNSTNECTIDWGWITTSICSGSSSNSQLASIISSALFIIVAESTVIFFPIAQVGWVERIETRNLGHLLQCVARNGPPLAVSTSAADFVAATYMRGPERSALCSLSTGISLCPVRLANRMTSGPAIDQSLFVRQGHGLPASKAAQVPHSPALPTMAVRPRRPGSAAIWTTRHQRRWSNSGPRGSAVGSRIAAPPGSAPWPPSSGANIRGTVRRATVYRSERIPRKPQLALRCGDDLERSRSDIPVEPRTATLVTRRFMRAMGNSQDMDVRWQQSNRT